MACRHKPNEPLAGKLVQEDWEQGNGEAVEAELEPLPARCHLGRHRARLHGREVGRRLVRVEGLPEQRAHPHDGTGQLALIGAAQLALSLERLAPAQRCAD